MHDYAMKTSCFYDFIQCASLHHPLFDEMTFALVYYYIQNVPPRNSPDRGARGSSQTIELYTYALLYM